MWIGAYALGGLGNTDQRQQLDQVRQNIQNAADAAALVSLAKAKANETFHRASAEGVQMHGGIGMTDEHEIGFFMKRARVCEELFGDANYHTEQLARARGY